MIALNPQDQIYLLQAPKQKGTTADYIEVKAEEKPKDKPKPKAKQKKKKGFFSGLFK